MFLRKKRTTKGVEWEPDPELTDRYGKDCRIVRIVLIDDDIENVFPTSYAWSTAVERKCWGDGTSAIRRTPEKPGGQSWAPCGSGCPELASGACKPSGDLRFVLADFPKLGSVCRIHTSSYRSIRQIHSALQEIRSFTSGRLAGLTAKLVVRPEEAAYFDSKDHRKKSTTIWALSVEVDGRDIKKLVASLTENARVFVETRKLLADGRVLEVVEDEAEEASEVAAEFYGAPEAAPAFSEKVNATDHTAETTRALARGIEKTAVGTITGANASIPVTAAIDDPEPPQTPPWELEVDRAPATSQTPASDTKPNGKASGSGAPPKTSRLHGIVGTLEPDAKGNTVRRNEHGAQAVWLMYPNTGVAYRYIPRKREPEVRIADTGGKFEEPELLPGFSLSLPEILG